MRLTVPQRHSVPDESLKLFYKDENPFFKTTLHFADSTEAVDLRDMGPVGSFTTAEWWQGTEHSDEQEALFNLLREVLEDESPRVQSQAAYYLSLLRDERVEPLIEVARRKAIIKELSPRPVAKVARVWIAGPFEDSDRDAIAHPPETQAIDLSAQYESDDHTVTWCPIDSSGDRFTWPIPQGGTSSTYAHFQLQSGARQPAMLSLATSSPRLRVWHNGSPVHESTAAANSPQVVLLDAQPGSNDLLIRSMDDGTTSEGSLAATVKGRADVSVTLPDRLDASLLAERLRGGTPSGDTISEAFASRDWSAEASRGDAERGRALFGTLGCTKCHAITNSQAGGGAPSLADAKRRFTVPHLVESLLLPSRQIAAPFRGTTIATSDGEVLTGLVVAEANEQVTLLLPDGTRRQLTVSEIDERETAPLSPMPAGLIKTPDELRDLLSYLLLDQPTPP